MKREILGSTQENFKSIPMKSRNLAVSPFMGKKHATVSTLTNYKDFRPKTNHKQYRRWCISYLIIMLLSKKEKGTVVISIKALEVGVHTDTMKFLGIVIKRGK